MPSPMRLTHPLTLCILLLTLLLTTVTNAQCATDQNPYCAGNAQFEQLCCTYPNICYWSNRNGDPACCPAGTDCSSNGGPSANVVAFTAVQQTTIQTTYLVQTVYTTTSPQYSTVTYYQTWQPAATTTTYVAPPVYTSFSTVVTPAVVVVTATSAVVAPVTTGGVYITVPNNNRAAITVVVEGCLVKTLAGVMLACAVAGWI